MSLRRCEVPCGRGGFCLGFCWLSMVHPLSKVGVREGESPQERKRAGGERGGGVRINGWVGGGRERKNQKYNVRLGPGEKQPEPENRTRT